MLNYLKQNIHLFALLLILWGCRLPSIENSSTQWQIYTNSRYNFTFPYPNNWASLPPPENNDGIVFVSPRNPAVEMRGWAGYRLPDSIIKEQNTKKTTIPNFQTAQGIPGVLTIEVGKQMAEMTLKLSLNQVNYYWQGRCESEKFNDYYRLFYYVAQQYKISPDVVD